jgi:hypothetical protein
MLRLNALNWKILSGNFMFICYLELIDLIWLSKTMKKKICIVMVAVTLLAFGSLSANAVEAALSTSNMTELTGVLSYSSCRFTIDGVTLHLGPHWYLITTQSIYDYDGDGNLETIFEELQGLIGTTVTVEGHLQYDNWISVFYINGHLYREPGMPPWQARTIIVTTIFSTDAIAGLQPGPAPNSGDGIPDGSGMDNQFQNGDPEGESPGPAPNSGDCIPDGSGF